METFNGLIMKETPGEAAQRLYPISDINWTNKAKAFAFVEGAIWQQERSYTEDELRGLLIKFHNELPDRWDIDNWLQTNKKK